MGSGRRANKRHKTLGLMSFVSDGRSSVLGIVEDLSKLGLKIGQIPHDFDSTADTCKAVVHSPNGDFKITLKPCWEHETNRGMYKTIGFQILDPPDGWTAFVEQLEKGDGELGFMILGNDEEE